MSSSKGRRALRRLAVVALTLPLTATAVVAGAGSAGAAVTAPGNGTVFTSYSSFTVSASYERSGSETRLTLTSPGGPEVTVASAPSGLSGGTLSYRLDTGCWTYPSESCSGGKLAPNGTWTVTQSGGGGGSSTFVTRIRPAAPSSLAATVLSPREVKLSWRRGAEPDLTGFQVVEGDAVVRDGIGLSACDGATCSAVVSYATDGSGEHTYAVRALRSTGPDSGTTLESPLSTTVSARLERPAPSPEPAEAGGSDSGGTGGPEPSSGPGAGGSDPGTGGSGSGAGQGPTPGSTSGGSTSGGGTSGGTAAPIGSAPAGGRSADAQAVAQRKAFALGFSTFGPKLGIPKLPPLPQAQVPAIAPELADGSYSPTLGFQDQVLLERVEVAQGPTQRVRHVVGTALDSERLATSSAAALVLLMAGAHLRRWLGVTHQEQ